MLGVSHLIYKHLFVIFCTINDQHFLETLYFTYLVYSDCWESMNGVLVFGPSI